MDAWIAAGGLVAATVLTFRAPARVAWHVVALVTGALAALPLLQHALGLVASSGNAWLSTAYLLGFLLALLTGARWEAERAGALADYLFLAIGIAALVSVGLQLHQWLMLERIDLWSMGGVPTRPFANFGQPNQLGSFLLWALLATAWGFVRRQIGAGTAIFLALYLLFGLALTQSRASWVAIALIVLAAWWWRGIWPSRYLALAITGLALYFALCSLSIGWLSDVLIGGLPPDVGEAGRMAREMRPAIWALFLDAVSQKPLFGYGWNQVGIAQMAVSVDHPALHAFLAQSHNLFLDLVLWCGIPVGLSVSILLLWWFVRCVRAVRHAEDALLVLVLLVIANHAMLELPLHHAHFLLPTGLFMGALTVRLAPTPVVVTGRAPLVIVWLACAVLLSLVIRDYARVEASTLTLRFEWARIKTPPAQSPDVLMLTQWTDYFRLIRLEPASGMSEADLQWMRSTTALNPNAGFYRKLAISLAMNGRPDEAALWMRRLCQIGSISLCAAAKSAWAQEAAQNPKMAAVPWPR